MVATRNAARLPQLTIREVKTSAVEVPMTYSLGTSAATVRRAPLLLIDLETEEGISGRTYLFCYRPSVPRAVDVVLRDAVDLVKGETRRRSTSQPSSLGVSRSSESQAWSGWRCQRSTRRYGMHSPLPQVCPSQRCSGPSPGPSPLTIRAAWG